MLKKWGFILLSLVVIMGCSEETEGEAEVEKSDEVVQTENEAEAVKSEVTTEVINKVEETNSSIETDTSVNVIDKGMYKVGVDVPSGEYMLIADEEGPGYFSIGSSSSSDGILVNDNFKANNIITIEDGQYVTIERAKMYPMSEAPTISPVDGVLSDGVYIIGKHLPAGEYKIYPTTGQSGYFSLHNGSSVSQLNDIIENGNFDGERYITVKTGQYLKINSASIKVEVQEISGVNTSLSKEIKLTRNEEDGHHYWKGEQELINGHDWMALNEEEKVLLIEQTVIQAESSGIVEINKSSEDYAEQMSEYFQEQTKRNEMIKVVLGDFQIDDILN